MPMILNGTGDITGLASVNSSVSAAEIGYLDGVTSALQTQINAKGTQTIGSWTATMPNGGTFNGPSTASMPYIRVGNLVTIWFSARMASVPNNSSLFLIGGLPFVPDVSVSMGSGSYARGFGSGPVVVNYYTSDQVYFSKPQTSTGGSETAITNATPNAAVNNFDVAFVLTYRTAS